MNDHNTNADPQIHQLEMEKDRILTKKDQAQSDIQKLTSQLQSFRNREASITCSLEESRRIAQNTEADAQKKADLILAEAEAEVNSCKQAIDQAQIEINVLKQREAEISRDNRSYVKNDESHIPGSSRTQRSDNQASLEKCQPAAGKADTSTIAVQRVSPISRSIDQTNADQPFLTMKQVAFLNARHYMTFQNKKGSVHGHSWQIQVELKVPLESSFVKFEDIEKIINGLLEPYQKTILNDVAPFNLIEPLTENLAGYFFTLFDEKFISFDCHLNKLTVWENPTKGVEICSRLPAFISASEILQPGLAQAAAAREGVDNVPAEDKEDGSSGAVSQPEAEVPRQPEIKPDPFGSHTGRKDNILHWVRNRYSSNTELPEQYKYPAWQLIMAVLVIIAAAVLAYYPLLAAPLNKVYPWGSDAWCHLFKAQFLYQKMLQGDYYPQFMAWWHNGVQPFRYWGPLSYTIIAWLNFGFHNIFISANYYILLCACLGGIFCLAFAKRIGLWAATVAGIVWVIWIDNLRVCFVEGNFPRILTIALLPVLLAVFLKLIEERQNYIQFILCALLIHLIVLCHPMIAAVYCVGLMVFGIISWFFGGSSIAGLVRGFIALAAGVASSAWWLLPSLTGSGAGFSKEATQAAVQYIPLHYAFNPYLRVGDYWGVSLLVLSLIFIFTWRSKPGWARSLFISALLMMLMALPQFKLIQGLLPLNNLLWPVRFSSLWSIAFIISFLAYNDKSVSLPFLKKRVMVSVFILITFIMLITDSYFSYRQLVHTISIPDDIKQCTVSISKVPGWRVAMLDLGRMESIPSYLISAQAQREQVFGWAWQGAKTANNVMLLNTALQFNWYPYLADRLAFMGTTDLIVKKDSVKQEQALERTVNKAGYSKEFSSAKLDHWHAARDGHYMLVQDKQCLAVGRYASIYALQYPGVEIGKLNKIDSYQLKDLQQYKTVILTGISWTSRLQAEKLIKQYARSGGQVLVDLTGFPADVLSRQPMFLGVYGESVTFTGNLTIYAKGQRMNTYPLKQAEWSCIVPQNLDQVDYYTNYYGNNAAILGFRKVKDGTPVYFIGGNLVYHSFLTHDPVTAQILQPVLKQSTQYQHPELVPIKKYRITNDGYSIAYLSAKDFRAVIPVAALDGFTARIDGKDVPIAGFENLVALRLPAGSHVIRLRLAQTAVYQWGRWITIICCLLALAGGLAMGRLKARIANNPD